MTAVAVRPTAVDLPLSYAQQQLWFSEQLAPADRLYNEMTVLRLDGLLDSARLEAALTAVVARHEVLRCTFHDRDGVPAAQVAPPWPVGLGAPIDLAYLGAGAEAAVTRYAGWLADEPYDLAAGPLVRFGLLRLGTRQHVLLLGMHHLVGDGWSIDVILGDLARAYTATPLPPGSGREYRDHVRGQRAGDDTALDYWTALLDGAPDLLDLRPYRLRPPVKGGRGTRMAVPLAPALARAVDNYALDAGTTRAGVLMAALAVVLGRWRGRDDVVLGSASEGRPHPDLEGVVGLFASLLPLRLRPEDGLTFAEFVDATTDTALDALDHQDFPFPRLVERCEAGRDASRPPLLQVVFTHHGDDSAPSTWDDVTVRREEISRGRARFDLLVEAYTTADRATLWIEYDNALYDEELVRRLVAHLANVLTAGLADPDTQLADLPMLTPGERAAAIAEPPPLGAPVPPRQVVLTRGGLLAPTGAVGELFHVYPPFVTLTGDRVTVLPGQPPLTGIGRLGYRDADGSTVALERHEWVDGALVPLDLVEAALVVHPRVRSVRVWATAEGALSAEVRPVGDGPWRDTLLAHAIERLPRYAVPDLCGPESSPPSRPAEVRQVVLEVAREALERSDLTFADDFFVAGGHSMLALRIVSELRRRLGMRVPVRQIFQTSVIGELADHVAVLSGPSPASPGPAALPVSSSASPGDETAPLTAAQADIWVVERLGEGRPVYNVPVAFDVTGPLDAADVAAAVETVAARHEALRVVVGYSDTYRMRQRVTGALPVLDRYDLRALPAPLRADEAARLERELATRPFDLTRNPGIRVALVRLDDAHSRLLLTAHHLVVDGVGLSVLCRELSEVLAARAEGRPVSLNPIGLTWTGYAHYEQRWIDRHRDELVGYWTGELAGVHPVELPGDRPRPPRLSFDGDHRERRLPDELAAAVARFATEQRATPFAVTTAAVATLVGHRCATSEVVVATPAVNRHHPDADSLIGCCIAMVPLRVALHQDDSFADRVARVRDRTLDALAHQGLPLPSLIALAAQERTGNRFPLFQIACDWQPDDLGLRVPGGEVRSRYLPVGTARNDLSITATAHAGGGLTLDAEYVTALWNPETIDGMLAELEDILRAGTNACTRETSSPDGA